MRSASAKDTREHTERPRPRRAWRSEDISTLTIIPRVIFRTLLLTILVSVALSTLGQLSLRVLPDFRGRDAIARLVYVDAEQSLPTLFQVVMLLSAAVLIAALARTERAGTRRRGWTFLAAALTFLGVDEFASLHEKATLAVRTVLDIESGPLWFAWVIPGAIAVITFAVVSASFVWRLPPDTRRRLLIAGGLYVSGALGIELIGGAYVADHGNDTWTYIAIASVEETLEMLGIVVVLYAALAHIAGIRPRTGLNVRVGPG